MKKQIRNGAQALLVAVGVSTFTAIAPAAEPVGNALENEGFTNLFNGTNWDGWYFKLRCGDAELAKKVYVIEDGVVHVFKDLPDGYQVSGVKNGTHGLFFTDKQYSQYILKFDYKWGKKLFNNFAQYQYDAGCCYHVVHDNIWPGGLEFQVRYDNLKNINHTGDICGGPLEWSAGPGNTFLPPDAGGVARMVGRGQHYALATAKFHGLDDQWNHCELIVMGDQYAIQKLNGQVVNLATKLSLHEGKIGFQSETGEVYYRNIQIKEFKEAVPMEQFLH